MELQRQTKRADEIINQFSQICVNAVLHQPTFSLETTKDVMKAIGRQHVADFLTRCYNGTEVNVNTYSLKRRLNAIYPFNQIHDQLGTDFLGGNPSAVKTLVEHNLLDAVCLYSLHT